jgi:hypothetical protein
MSQRNFSQLVRGELAALFVASFLAALFLLGQGLSKALLLLVAVFAMLQPFLLLYHYFRRRD